MAEGQGKKHSQADISRRMDLMRSIFQKEAEIHDLKNEQMEMQQQLVNLDMKMYGRLSQKTAQILEGFHCEILNGRVREVFDWERNLSPETEGKSVHEKLDAYKAAEKQQPTDDHIKEHKRETPEIG